MTTHPRRAMRPSGVRVIGDVPTHWSVRPLRQLGRLLKGVGGTKEDVVEEGVPCVRYGDLYTTHREAIDAARTYLTAQRARAYTPIQFGDVLFAASGEKLEEIGKSAVNLIPGEARCGGDLIVLRPTMPLVPRFLGYAADAWPSVAQKTTMGRGTTVKHIYPDELRQLALAIPPIDEQQRIADFLDRKTAVIDELIAKKERLVALLAEKRQALITQLVTKGLDPTVPMKDSGVPFAPHVPASWRVARLKHVAAVRTGIALGRALRGTPTQSRPYLRVANVQSGYLRLDDVLTIDVTDDEADRYALLRGDVLMNEGGDNDKLGRGYVWESQIPGCLHQNHVFAVRPRPGVDSYWLNWASQAEYLREFFLSRAKQTTNLASISSTNLGEAPIVLPPVSERGVLLKRLLTETRQLDGTRDLTNASIDRLREYRQALITAAVTGQMDVTNEHAIAAHDERVAEAST